MKASELVYLSETELDTKLAELKQELFNLRFQLAVNQLDNPQESRLSRRISHASRPFSVSVRSRQTIKEGG